MFEFYACSCLDHLSQIVKTKTNKQNEGVQLKLFHESKFHLLF